VLGKTDMRMIKLFLSRMSLLNWNKSGQHKIRKIFGRNMGSCISMKYTNANAASRYVTPFLQPDFVRFFKAAETFWLKTKEHHHKTEEPNQQPCGCCRLSDTEWFPDFPHGLAHTSCDKVRGNLLYFNRNLHGKCFSFILAGLNTTLRKTMFRFMQIVSTSENSRNESSRLNKMALE